jgi:hypothetical protein
MAEVGTMTHIAFFLSLALFGWGEMVVPSSLDAVMLDDYESCGLTSLFVICKLRGVPVDWENIKKLLGPHEADGTHSFAEIARAAEALGMNPIGMKATPNSLGALPLPAIVQVHDPREPQNTPHLLVLLGRGPDGVTLLDPPYPHYFLPEARFEYTWTGNIMLFAHDESEAQAIRSRIGNHERLVAFLWFLGLGGVFAAAAMSWRSWAIAIGGVVHAILRGHAPSRLLLCAVCCVLLLAGFAVTVGIRLAKEKAPEARCVLEKPVVELGELSPGPVDYSIFVSNGGTAPLRIHSISSACSCAIVKGPQIIEPGQSKPINVRISASRGPGNARLTVESNDPEGPKHILLSWHGKARPRIVPFKLDEESLSAGSPFVRTVRMIYPGGKSALQPKILGCDCDSPRVHLRPGRSNPQAERFAHAGFLTQVLGEQEITVHVDPPPGGGSIKSKCRIRVKYGASELSLDLPIWLAFQCQDITTDVSAVSFSAPSPQGLIGLERLVQIKPARGAPTYFLADAPPWLEGQFTRNDGAISTLHLRVKEAPSKPLELARLHIGQVGRPDVRAALSVSAFSPPR